MQREHSTPVRRLNHCRILYRPWRVPTLISYPPPPPRPAPYEPVVALARPSTPPEHVAPMPVRSRSERRRRDCVFIPDMDIALQFLEARRIAMEGNEPPASSRRPYALPRHELADSPVAIGLLMTVAPPLAITLVWSSTRFAPAAQWALTAYGVVVTLVLAALALSALSA
jgi:hypothetical protein